MEKNTLKTIANWCGGTLNSKDAEIDDIVIDSRAAVQNCLFFCIRGEKTDGHNYIETVRSKGGYSLGENDTCDIKVKSTISALADVAREYLKIINPTVIGVTGSSGKTTTTRLIECILKEDVSVKSTLKNFNNHIGLPLSILNMNKDTQIGVLEMGANHREEIKYLCSIASPRIGVITNVGDAHIGYFGSRQEILKTKFELADALPENGFLIYNSDQEDVREKALSYGNKLNLIGFGLGEGANIRANILEQSEEASIFEIEGYRFKLKMPGRFNIYNAVAAIAVAKVLNMDFSVIYPRLKGFHGLSHRMKRININNFEILDDSYNSNPTSVKSLFGELLKIYPQKDIIAVVGEMLELGDYSEELHQSTGEYISNQDNIKCLLAGGRYADHLIEGACKGKIGRDNIYKFKDTAEAAKIIKDIATERSLVVLKASRRQSLEEVVGFLKKK
jgi:UDP-N-acetylmuramoyl-tripeptide--D-alanyl-D-alanine ligase